MLEEKGAKEPSLLIENLWDAPKALIACALGEITHKHVLFISGIERESALFQDLSYFSKKPPLSFPSWETLPGDEIPPNRDIIGKRLEILYHLTQSKDPQIILAPLQAALQKVCAPNTLKKGSSTWKKGLVFPFETLAPFLADLGYQKEAVVTDKGQFALRGGILDLFPISSFDPYRIDFFGDEIDDIRTFDPISQKSTGKADSLLITPADELALLKNEKHLSTLFDYLGKETLVVYEDLLAIEDRYVALKNLPGMNSSLLMPFKTLQKEIAPFQKVYFSKTPIEALSESASTEKMGRAFYTGKNPLQEITFEIFNETIQTKRLFHPFQPLSHLFNEEVSEEKRLQAVMEKMADYSIECITASQAEEDIFKKYLNRLPLPLPKTLTYKKGYLASGFFVEEEKFALLPFTELSKRHKVDRQKWRTTSHTPASEFHQLEKGDLVVHFHNGIGKYCGIEKQKNHLGEEEEFLILNYAGNSKLFVPLAQSHLVSRYIGTHDEKPALHTLGTKKWQSAKASAQKAILGYARDLLHMQAEREAKGGFSFEKDSDDLFLFEEEFPFIATDDQLNAVAAIKEDMQSKKAMDRLICGDVGYGKTEVAMRAAFKAVIDGGKQVALLVPTTVLAMQHYETFTERMANFPIQVGVASRFIKPKVLKETLEKARLGTLDILIGTHRLISKDVGFRNLGLIIIDEEQRFGVRVKEHLKQLKVGVDSLTLSATPIPRTLYFSLVGARDMSVINTPPQDRLPIKTILAEREGELIKNALLRELARDGQAYFIHNRVESIYKIVEEIEKLVPAAKVAAVHGQMPADSIDAIFQAFKDGETDVLVATTIIENGIDIPNANTILIDRADAYGMADLYQLRGRVGRWSRPAYAYFLIPKNRELAEISRKRLSALVETSGFGGGMKLAMRDLEIRGAGDLLGVQQSGNVSAIGFHFYCKLLKRTIQTMQKKISPTFFETKIESKFPASLPDTYIPETSLRMEFYHRLGEATALEEINTLFDELIDRFGSLPIQAEWLRSLSRIKVFASCHQFTLLKFERIALSTERQCGKKMAIRKIPFPTCKTPEELETIAMEMLSRLSL